MKNIFSFIFLVAFATLTAQVPKSIPVTDNFVVDGIPPLPATIAEEVKPYTEARGASFEAWHPVSKQIFIMTRFGNTPQIHHVKMPGGDRKQLTFFGEAPQSMTLQPTLGNYFLFTKDVGGNEFTQMYRYDSTSGKSTMLTNGEKAQNGNIIWNKKGSQILYTSTVRNGADRDIFTMDPLRPETNRKVLEVEGGGWGISDWSDDEQLVLLGNYISVNESSIWLYSLMTGAKTKLLPQSEERTIYQGIKFTPDNKGIYILTNKNSEFQQPAIFDLATKQITYLVTDINWEIESYDISDDGKSAVFVTNEAGISKLYIQNLKTRKYTEVKGLPAGIISDAHWHKNNNLIGFSFGTSTSSSDIYEWDVAKQKLTRWTESELGGMNLEGIEAPQLVKWKSFDGLEISGFLYKANAKFTGPRPVIINIHGGPEGQSQPGFLGRNNYYLNELGVSIIFPNVRGSTGYGKTFTDLDNGFKREDSVKDIGALLDWIATQPTLDASRVMITGGSYGGYMTLACAFHYNDRIKCSSDIVGISNFNTFLKNTESYRRDLRRVEYGDERIPEMAAFFEKIAPLNNAGKIKKPMFI
ncbi:MAG TPA: prolyl oligopeptidase family serine peptidase, partial [Flavobacterium sp.]